MPNVILLSGGSGTRLWPLSNTARSKQFLKVLRSDSGAPESMVQRTIRLIRQACPEANITVATSTGQADALEMQVQRPFELSVDPERRDTAPAIMLASAHIAWEQGADLSTTVVVMPIDTYADSAYYEKIVLLDAVVQTDVASIVLMGVEPTEPTSKYGYIVPKDSEGDIRAVERFAELCERYQELPKNSFDYEVVEKAESVSVVPYSGAWKDLGTWSSLTEEMTEATSGMVWMECSTTKNVHIVNETGLPMVVTGLSDAVVVATSDGILVSGKEASDNVKDLVAEVAFERPMYEKCQWGEYRVLDVQEYADGSNMLTEELVLNSGRQLPYQRYQNRFKVWTVAAGTGEVVIDGEVVSVGAGDSVRIAPMQMHSAKAKTDLHLVEVQVGCSLVKEDMSQEEQGHKF